MRNTRLTERGEYVAELARFGVRVVLPVIAASFFGTLALVRLIGPR